MHCFAQGVEMQPEVASRFRASVLSGDTESAIALLPQLSNDTGSIRRAKYLLLCRQYRDLIESGQSKSALKCLREQIQPIEAATTQEAGQDESGMPRALPQLAAMLLDLHPHPCHPKRRREGSDLERQEGLLLELQELLSPEMLLPDARLEHLVEQALLSQIERCPYHNSRNTKLSLMEDYRSGPESLPTVPSQELVAHEDEVWVVHFSPDGRWLVSASKDGSAALWSVGDDRRVRLHKMLVHGGAPINVASFSPTSDAVMVSGGDGKLKFFQLPDGAMRMEIHSGSTSEGISAAMWVNSTSRIAIACNKEIRLMDISLGGRVVDKVTMPQHAYDAILSADGGTFVTVGQDRYLRFVRFSDHKMVSRGPEPAAVTCLSRSPDGRFLAANLANGCIHVWPLGDLSCPESGAQEDPLNALPSRPLHILKGMQSSHPGRFVIRSAFGGANAAFVATGSESSLLHIWHRETSSLLASVEGHSATVNAVSWNPTDDHMMASASDDHRVIIWQSQAQS